MIDTLDVEIRESLAAGEENRGFALGRVIKQLRPELDLFLVTDAPVEDIAGHSRGLFRRIFYRQEDYQELHGSMLRHLNKRFEAPFFNALMAYIKKPTGVFHAMPISRGKSISKSHWIQDIGRFYGPNIFRAETSATTGGLDSLLQPMGPLKRAQEAAARAFGARRTFFVTNGTSTGNKIVVQALVRPGDIVLVDRDCHKSHHYGLMLAGAQVVYLDSYPLSQYSMYGAVPTRTIKEHLLELQAAGKLDRVRMVLLTNCTFDGLTYDPQTVMQELLAIKPDLIFLWDEAWFAFAYFNPTLRRRTSIESARRLRERYRSEAYREEYQQWRASREGQEPTPEDFLEGRVLADPERARVRVYATQSTHKTLTSMRQGSMIHVYDQDFAEKVSGAFLEAYMTHTSTSPNYQILASLDVGRRQVELEGYELVQKSIELAMLLRRKLQELPLLKRYFEILGPAELIPKGFRPSKINFYYDPKEGWSRMEKAWAGDEFALDPTRITLDIGRTGMDGDTFRQHLMDEYDIQINKTSRNTVLFMVHIGTTRGAVARLIEVLVSIAETLEERFEEADAAGRALHQRRVRALTEEQPPLPDFSRFHDRFRAGGKLAGKTPEGNLRDAYFLAYDSAACEYLRLDGEIVAAMEAGREVVSATFVIPYPPGFPILVPGQVISREILAFLKALDIKEIHGYQPDYGLKVFTEESLNA
jgi:arginine decarboxylase